MGDLKRALKKAAERKDIVLPLECHYLNKNAFLSVVGHQPQATKHFSLKRKPKAAALRAELLNKSQVFYGFYYQIILQSSSQSNTSKI